jgi:hypothetical protein
MRSGAKSYYKKRTIWLNQAKELKVDREPGKVLQLGVWNLSFITSVMGNQGRV